jgi:hypothetical protein
MGSPEEQRDLKQYPRTYTVDARTRRDLDAIAIALPALFICIIGLHLVGIVPKNNNVTLPDLLAIGLVLGLLAFLGISRTHRRVVLYQDRIEILGWFSARRLKRSEILGRRMGYAGPRFGPAFYIIVPVDRSARVLTLPSALHVDKDFHSWMSEIPSIKKERRSAKS